MRSIFLILIAAVLLVSCDGRSAEVEQELTYHDVQELGGIPVPDEAKQTALDPAAQSGYYEVSRPFETFYADYHDKLKQEGWKVSEVESHKVVAAEKNDTKLLVIVTRLKGSDEASNLVFRAYPKSLDQPKSSENEGS
ncbi:hypothetical protein CDO73_08320 [Saccharibacillus sp. O23]|uniref:hypothetical protein n=1 Tax=Saccharibacillus sp. O23 TaxID=2009338 RepID=UPI000B4E2616|nr:hypothetical protein [Saccharibacillus sp. O23]OWR31131.1 hypothetical protein CDO73_08320 [Saccharibacillus sp. O23]